MAKFNWSKAKKYTERESSSICSGYSTQEKKKLDIFSNTKRSTTKLGLPPNRIIFKFPKRWCEKLPLQNKSLFYDPEKKISMHLCGDLIRSDLVVIPNKYTLQYYSHIQKRWYKCSTEEFFNFYKRFYIKST